MNALINATIYDFVAYRANQYVLFDDVIRDVGDMAAYPGVDGTVWDCQGTLVLPGFVLAHTHIYSTFARGLSLPFHPTNFQEILDQLWWKLDAQIDKDVIYHSGIAFCADAIKSGVTTLFDHHASGKEIAGTLNQLKRAVVDKAGLRGCFAFETSDRFDVDACIRENVTFGKQNQTAFARGMFGLHASMSLSEATLEKVRKAKEHLKIHVHVAESEMDQFDAISRYRERVVKRLDRHKLLDEGALLVHCLYVSEDERRLIRNSGATVVFNPVSNLNNGVGIPNHKAMKDLGIPIVVGNDGMGSGLTSDLKSLVFLSHYLKASATAFPLADLKALLIESYRLASNTFEIPIGRLAEGFAADFQIVPYRPFTPLDETNVFGHLFYGLFDNWRPESVFVAGKPVLQKYQLTPTIQTELDYVLPSAERLWARLKEDSL
jgi:cytosine/adenosine deaminase-related metal-dependent hydrolase